MLALRDVQRHMRDALLDGDVRAASSTVRGDGLAPEARLAIYRHHVVTTLTDALAATFPVVRRLVDPRFFAYAVARYLRDDPPAGPCLAEYGATFPEFLRTFPPCRDLGYLPDVARLEWALNTAYHADDAPALDPARLAGIAPARWPSLVLRLHPAITLLASPWPVDAIWRANQPDADADAVVDLAAGPVALEVSRAGDEPVLRRLGPGMHRFRAALAAGRTFGDAAEQALMDHAAFDLACALHELLVEGAIVDAIDSADKETLP